MRLRPADPLRQGRDLIRPFLVPRSDSDDVSTDRSNGLRNRDYRLFVIIAADAVDDLEDALGRLPGVHRVL